jgi:hypothetical protein
MMTMVRVVLSNGASIMMPQAWQLPLSAARRARAAPPTKFLDVDYTNHERFTGVPNRRANSVGRRAKFDNKFVTSGPGPTASAPASNSS